MDEKKALHWCLALAVAACGTLTGCARIGKGQIVSTDDKIISTHNTRVTSKDAVGGIRELNGTILSLSLTTVCSEVRIVEVEKTTVWENVNQTPQRSWAMFGVGVLAAVLGGVMMANPETTDEDTGEKGPLFDDQQNAYIAGGVTMGIGGALLLFPMVDGLRAVGTTKESTTSKNQTGVVTPLVRCGTPKQIPSVNVLGNIAGQEVELGATNSQGLLSVDLRQVVPRGLVSGPLANLKMLLSIRDGEKTAPMLDESTQTQVAVDLDPLHAYFDDLSWSEVDLTACMAAETLDACVTVEGYLREFPNGKHVSEANGYLLEVKARLDAMREAAERARQAELERIAREQEEQRLQWERERRAAEAKRAAEEAAWREQQQQTQERIEREKVEQQRRQQCQIKCQKSCGGNSQCVQSCVKDTCR